MLSRFGARDRVQHFVLDAEERSLIAPKARLSLLAHTGMPSRLPLRRCDAIHGSEQSSGGCAMRGGIRCGAARWRPSSLGLCMCVCRLLHGVRTLYSQLYVECLTVTYLGVVHAGGSDRPSIGKVERARVHVECHARRSLPPTL